MRIFNYSALKEQKWDSEILGLIAAIYKEAGKQELYLKQQPQKLEKLVEIAKIQSTEASNAIENIVTTSTRIKQLVEEKTAPRNRDEQEIAGYADLLSIIFDNFQNIPLSENYIKQLHKILLSYSDKDERHRGEYKKYSNRIVAFDTDGNEIGTIFETATPFDTPRLMQELIALETEHPEYFSLVNGERKAGAEGQLCLSNPQMRAELAKNVIKKRIENGKNSF